MEADKIKVYIKENDVDKSKVDIVKMCLYSDVPEEIMEYILEQQKDVGMAVYEIYIGAEEEWFYIIAELLKKDILPEMKVVFSDLLKYIAINLMHKPDKYAEYIKDTETPKYDEICKIKNKIEAEKTQEIHDAVKKLKQNEKKLCESISEVIVHNNAMIQLDKCRKEKKILEEEVQNLNKQIKNLNKKIEEEPEIKKNQKKKFLRHPRDKEELLNIMINHRLDTECINAINSAVKLKVPIQSIIKVIINAGTDEIKEYINTLIYLTERKK